VPGQVQHHLVLRLQQRALFERVGDLEHKSLSALRFKQEILIALAGQRHRRGVEAVQLLDQALGRLIAEGWCMLKKGHLSPLDKKRIVHWQGRRNTHISYDYRVS
jgi:hypothetical protein